MRRIDLAPAIVFLAALVLSAGVLSAQGFNPNPGFNPGGFNPGNFNSGVVPPASTVPRLSELDQVRDWYQNYLGRDPGQDAASYADLLRRGMSPIDVQASILGADDLYARQARDANAFVRETFQSVFWREPTAAEYRQWTDRLTQLRGDRFTLAREILASSLGQGASPGGAGATQQVVDLSTRMVTAAQLLASTADFELSGTVQGRQVSLRAQALADAADTLRREVVQGYARPEQLAAEMGEVERALDAVIAALNNPPGTAPSAASIARRVQALAGDLHLSLRLPYEQPGQLPGGAPSQLPGGLGYQSYDYQRLLTQIDSVQRGAQSVLQLYGGRPGQSTATFGVVRDLELFANQAESLRSAAQRGASAQRLTYDVQQMEEQASRIRPQLAAGRPPVFARLYWNSVESSLQQIRETLRGSGGVGGPAIDPGPIYRPNQELLSLADQAIAQCDAFLLGLQPYVLSIREVPRLQADVRVVKNRTAQFRQQLLAGDGAPQLAEQVRLAKLDFETAYERWSQIVETYRLTSYTRLSPIGRSLEQIDQLLTSSGAIAGGGGAVGVARPVFDSRIGPWLQTVDLVVAEAKQQLTPFVNYPEHRDLVRALDGVSSYNRALTDALQGRTGNLAAPRNSAALMQRAAEQADIFATRIEDRARAVGEQNAVQQALLIHRNTDRLLRLVLDIEREVQ